MIELKKGKLPAKAVPIGKDGEVIYIRPATDFEIRQARATISRQIAGLLSAQDAAMTAVQALGEEYADADFAKPEWQAAAIEALTLAELAWLCQSGWSGVTVDGAIVAAPTRELIGLLLRDHTIAGAVEKAINEVVHREQAEGNALPPLPDGTARAAEASVPSAAISTSPAAGA